MPAIASIFDIYIVECIYCGMLDLISVIYCNVRTITKVKWSLACSDYIFFCKNEWLCWSYLDSECQYPHRRSDWPHTILKHCVHPRCAVSRVSKYTPSLESALFMHGFPQIRFPSMPLPYIRSTRFHCSLSVAKWPCVADHHFIFVLSESSQCIRSN